jgi:predicted metalloprotease
MKWRNRRKSSNIEDRRGMSTSTAAKGGGIGLIALALIGMYFGIDPRVVMQVGGQLTGGGETTTQRTDYRPTAEQQQLGEFTSVILADSEDAWHAMFKQIGMRYQEPKLVLFTNRVQSACGAAEAAMGPFYCPGDRKVYIDLGFFSDLKKRHNAPGDFAQAYVVAHEVGHHVQNLLGISTKVQNARSRMSQEQGNALSVRLELQADCFAGLWAQHTERAKHVLDQGDIEEALNAASAIGDDRLQKQARGFSSPESFTHGSSKQRVKWFKKGLLGGNMNDCDTFS